MVGGRITLNISQVAENGSTATPTSRSATASDTMKRLVTDLNFDEQKTAAITRQLPTITITLISAKIERDVKRPGSLQFTSSKSAAQADAFNVLRITAYAF